MNFKEWLQNEAQAGKARMIKAKVAGSLRPSMAMKSPSYFSTVGLPDRGTDKGNPLVNIGKKGLANLVQDFRTTVLSKTSLGQQPMIHAELPHGFNLFAAYEQGKRKFPCPQCGKTISPPPDASEGEEIQCEWCKAQIRVPQGIQPIKSVQNTQNRPQERKLEDYQSFALPELKNMS